MDRSPTAVRPDFGEYFNVSGPYASASERTMCDAKKAVLAYSVGRKLVVTARGFSWSSFGSFKDRRLNLPSIRVQPPHDLATYGWQ